MKKDILYRKEVYEIVGAAMEVHNILGPGFLEAVYQEAMEIELTERRIPFKAQQPLKIAYKGHTLKKEYVPDLVIYEKIVVDIKALEKLGGKEESQLINYLKATKMRVGLLLNFGVSSLERKRFIL